MPWFLMWEILRGRNCNIQTLQMLLVELLLENLSPFLELSEMKILFHLDSVFVIMQTGDNTTSVCGVLSAGNCLIALLRK